MTAKKTLQPIIIIAAGLALLAGGWFGYYTEKQKVVEVPEIYGTLLPSGKALTQFQLTDHNNQKLTEKNFLDNWTIVFTGYTNCPDVCPTSLTALQQTVELMQSRQMAIPKVLFISIDPERDTTEKLASYVTYFNKDFIAATGPDAALKNITKQLAAFYAKTPGASGDINEMDYLMDHSAVLILINPKAEIQAFFQGPHYPELIIESLVRSQQYYDATQ